VADQVRRERDPSAHPALARLLEAFDKYPAAHVEIGPRAISADGVEVLDLEADRAAGAPAVTKRAGPRDLYIVPLAKALAARGVRLPLVIVVEPTTPYRLLVEVLFTAAQTDNPQWDLRIAGDEGRGVLASAPRASAGDETRGFTLLVASQGIAMQKAGTAPRGCSAMDRTALAVCVGEL